MTHEFDYRVKQGEGIELIVRPNNKYGSAGPGQRVLVDECELRNPSTMSACMTEADQAAADAEREQARLDAEAFVAKKRSVKTAVEAGLENLAVIAAAKAKAKAEELEFEALKAQKEAVAAAEAFDDYNAKRKKKK